MRLIPGKTKVQIELFKGVTLADIFIGLVGVTTLIFILISNISGKIYWSIGTILFTGFLLVRIDEPNYVFLLRIFRHLGYKHRFVRKLSDRELLAAYAASQKEDASEEDGETEERDYFGNDIRYSRPGTEPETADEPVLSEAERKKALKEKIREEDRILKSKDSTKEEIDAVWLERAKRSAEKKEKRGTEQYTKHAYDMSEIIGFTKIDRDLIEYGGEYFGAVIEIPPVEFRFFSEHRRNNSIENAFGRLLRTIAPDYAMNIVKIERPVPYEAHLETERTRMDALRASYESGMLSEDEFKARSEILMSRYDELWSLNNEDRVIEPYYYIVLYNSDRAQLNNAVEQALIQLKAGEMKPHRLNTKELAVFLKYTNQLDFDEHDVDKIEPENLAKWAMPESVSFQPRTAVVNGIITHNMRVTAYPTEVGDAWLATVMTLPATKMVVKCKPMERDKAIRRIDRSLQELRGQYMATGIDSRRMELEEHIDTLSSLLATLQGDNESLLEVNIFITAYDAMLTKNTRNTKLESQLSQVRSMKRFIRRSFNENGLKLSGMDFDQVNTFIGAQVNALDPLAKSGRGIPSNTVAACYPWVFASINDKGGIKLGEAEGVPVFIDFFRRDSERVNSNMVIVGKSGSGKSYATKALLANLASDDAKIYILDPENEYTELAHNLHGKFINVGNAQQGRINPFQIITALDDDEDGDGGASGSYSTHLQFLEEFFRQILPDCDKDSMEYLNSLIDRMYMNHGITAETNLSLLTPDDYPTFDDLYDAVLAEFQAADNEYVHSLLRTLINYVAKFSAGGRNANIWNGPSTITTDENFTVFNFQSLLANRNGAIANAQMLLVLKYVDNEIIKNRDYNTRHHAKRKIVVVIDEAHVFIDTKYPAALDFMFQLAKRIRKYNGMQIVITQNIKDFVGSEELARKSTAIINACQYSFIFSLAPNDMDDLCKLYEKSGGINENEQEEIVSAPRGQAFTVMSPQSRSSFQIEVPQNVVSMFRSEEYEYQHFGGEEGEENWEELVGDSRAVHEKSVSGMKRAAYVPSEKKEVRRKVSFLEMDEEDYEEELAKLKPIRESKKPEDDFDDDDFFFEELDEVPEEAADTKTPVQAAPAVQPAAPAAVQPAIDPAIVDRLSRLTYDAMVEEIRRSVKSELESQRIDVSPVQKPVYAPPESEEEDNLAALTEGFGDEDDDEAADDFSFDFDSDEEEGSGYGDTGEAADDEYEEEDSGASSLGSIFNADALAMIMGEDADEEDRGVSDSEDEDGDDDFDLMKMLMDEADESDDLTCFELMEQYDEQTMEITIDDLIRYNHAHRG